jgi:hypothetical protein
MNSKDRGLERPGGDAAVTSAAGSSEIPKLELLQLRPYFSIYILECVVEDPVKAFDSLVRFLRSQAGTRGQALAADVVGEVKVDGEGSNDAVSIGPLAELGFDRLYGIVRRRTQSASWAMRDSPFIDVVHELTLALARNRLVAIRSDIVSSSVLLKWAGRSTTPFQALPPEILAGTFDGDGTMLWMQGVHRQRASKANAKSLIGTRLQEAVDALEDATYAMSAMAVNVAPAEQSSVIRGQLTISPDKSKVSLKAMSGLYDFLVATDETLGMLEKSLSSEEPPAELYPVLAVREKDLKRVFGAYDLRIATPEEVQGMAHADQATLDRAELLRGSLFDVEGDERSPVARVVVGSNGSTTGRLQLQPVAIKGGGFELDVRYSGIQSDAEHARVVKEALQDGDLVALYYESGHMLRDGRVVRQSVNAPPFTAIDFADFEGFNIMQEKPRAHGDQAIHNSIGTSGDKSLFAWVVSNIGATGWTVCDDGAGEVADFLHLDEDGTLTAIHVKGARSKSSSRGIAVTAFEEVVSQAEKNVRSLAPKPLLAALQKPRIAKPACWVDGTRVDSRDEFVARLETRISADRTRVVLLQPHLLKSTHDAARSAIDSDNPGRNSSSLRLLDNLLHSTKRTITAFWDDLRVIGSA